MFSLCLFSAFCTKVTCWREVLFQVLLYNFLCVGSLVVHKEYKDKVYWILKVHIRNKVAHPLFVVKMPGWWCPEQIMKKNQLLETQPNRSFSRNLARMTGTSSILRKKQGLGRGFVLPTTQLKSKQHPGLTAQSYAHSSLVSEQPRPR